MSARIRDPEWAGLGMGLHEFEAGGVEGIEGRLILGYVEVRSFEFREAEQSTIEGAGRVVGAMSNAGVGRAAK